MNMMTSTEGMLDIRQSAFVNRLERKTKREGNASQGLPTTAKSLTAGIQSVKQELDAVRTEQAKVQQAIYEAAQIQRKLCAPRELVWGEFEIAGESFPVRHLSGDFFKVMELDSALGLTVGDIAGKGLSAGIWQAHLMGLVRRCARRHSDPAAAVAEVNLELCQDSSEPPITALFFAGLDPQDDLTLLVVRRREGTMIERSPSRGKDFSTPHRGPTSVVRPKKAERRGNRSNS